MRCVLVIVLLCGAAAAQPGASVPPPNTYQPQTVQLTDDEQDLLASGYVTPLQHIGGAAAALFIGVGVGQAVQGRWHETGWIFSLGEPVAIVGLSYGALKWLGDCGFKDNSTSCSSTGEPWFWGGLVAFGALHVWEVVDAITEPPEHNRRLHALRARLGIPEPMYFGVRPYAAPGGNGGGVAGVTLSF